MDYDAVAAHVGSFARVLWRTLVFGYRLRILAWYLELCARTRFVDSDFCSYWHLICHSRPFSVIPASEPDILQGECRDRLLTDCHDRAAEDGAKAQSPLLTYD